jgi:hypothetical protein
MCTFGLKYPILGFGAWYNPVTDEAVNAILAVTELVAYDEELMKVANVYEAVSLANTYEAVDT